MELWNKKMLIVMVFMMTTLGGVAGYKNYTVGGDLGWFDKLEKPTVDYQKWASSKTFSLGDFLSMFSLSLSLALAHQIFCFSCLVLYLWEYIISMIME